MIFTGYYSKMKLYKDNGYKTVSISVSEPKSIEVGGKIKEFCPTDILSDYKSGLIDEEKYKQRYIEQLDKLGIRNILLKIHQFGDNVVLLCWESPEKFCHRHILADYINQHSKLKIVEFNINNL